MCFGGGDDSSAPTQTPSVPADMAYTQVTKSVTPEKGTGGPGTTASAAPYSTTTSVPTFRGSGLNTGQ